MALRARPAKDRKALAKWLNEKDYELKAGQGLSFTHTSLVGAVYDVTLPTSFLNEKSSKGRPKRHIDDLTPAEKQARAQKQELNFLKHYGASEAGIIFRKHELNWSTGKYRRIGKSELNFISEKITPVFKYFVDLDFAADSIETLEGVSSEKQLQKRIAKAQEKIRTDSNRKHAQTKLKLFNAYLQQLNHQRLLALVRLLQDVLKEFYPGLLRKQPKAFTVLVCTTLPKQKSTRFGEGVHLIFPYLEVDSAQALNLRENMIYRLEQSPEFGDRPENSWRTIFDEGVYGERGGALRMLGSRKAEKCKTCNKEVKERKRKRKEAENGNKTKLVVHNTIVSPGKQGTSAACKDCREQYVWTSRIYWPEYMLDSNGEIMPELAELLNPNRLVQPPNPAKPPRPDNLFTLMRMASLRTYSAKPTPEFRMPAGAIRYVPMKPALASKSKPKKGEPRDHEEDLKTLSKLKAKYPFVKDHPWIPLLQKLIYRKFGDVYRNSQIRQVFALHNKDSLHPTLLISLAGPGSNYCLNINGDHNSNTVYFMLDEKGMHQRCGCQCDKERPSGVMCKRYRSETKSISDVPLLQQRIFPQMYHGVPWIGRTERKWKSLPVGFTDVLWNRIQRSKPLTPIEGIGPDDITVDITITQGDDGMTEELVADIERQILGCDPKLMDTPEPSQQEEDPEDDDIFKTMFTVKHKPNQKPKVVRRKGWQVRSSANPTIL